MPGIQKMKNERFRVTLDQRIVDGVRKRVYKTVNSKVEVEKIVIEFEENKKMNGGVSI
ncbi:hypothetical protein ABHN11_22080 [Brevibacillus centrosporus]|uniref:hypothetical protein n=1 Tax=Brevibacillus centrosporus TaxID=54910 RepID=UPI003D1E09FA